MNRFTFYLHYKNVSELLYETLEYMIDQFIEAFPKTNFSHNKPISQQDKSELYLVSSEYLIPYLGDIRANRRLFSMALMKADALRLHKTYDKLFTNIIDPIMQRFGIPERAKVFCCISRKRNHGDYYGVDA